jgi:hypothetical protein
MRTIVLALAVAAAPVLALAGDSDCDVNTFILRDGTTTRVSGSTDDLNRFEAQMRDISGPALFTRIDGEDYVISDSSVSSFEARGQGLMSSPTRRWWTALGRSSPARCRSKPRSERSSRKDRT